MSVLIMIKLKGETKMVLIWFFLMVLLVVGCGILQAVLTKDESFHSHSPADSDVEPWEGY